MTSMNDAIVHFTIGSSPIITIFPFLVLYNAYSNLSEEEKTDSRISFTAIVAFLPIVSGIMLAITYKILEKLVTRKTSQGIYLRFVVSGAISALVISLILDYGLHIYQDWLDMDNNTIMFHATVLIFYLILYYTIGQWLRAQLLYGPQKPSSSSSSSKSHSSSSSSSSSGSSSSIFDSLAKKAASKS